MYHWYLLLRLLKAPKVAAADVVGCQRFSAFHVPEVEVPEEVRRKMFRLSAVEFSPVAAGLGVGMFFESTLAFAWTFFAGLVLSGVVCWMLRNKVPPTVIHVVAKAEPPEQKSELL